MKNHFALLYFFPFLLALPFAVAAQLKYITGNEQLPAHPRLLLLKGEEAAIKKTAGLDATWAGMHKAITDEADRLLPLPPIEHI